MLWLWLLVILLVAFGSVLAMAEASMSRMTRVRAMALREAGRRNAVRLERMAADPTRFLNAIYLCVMFVQNGSAILVAILVEQAFGEVSVTVLSVVFTLAYFVVVEAMSKTFGILHSDTVALRLTPLVWGIGRALSGPTRLLIGLANLLLPGKGLQEGPFVSPEEIRTMVEVGEEEGSIEEHERTLIHSVFRIGRTRVRDVMVPRPDVIAVPVGTGITETLDLMLAHGHWRLPVFRGDPADVRGVAYAEDLVRRLRAGRRGGRVDEVMHPPYFVPESKDVADLLREMQDRRIHVAIVVDEYGSVVGMATLEDLLEELVGDISDEYDRREPAIQAMTDRTFRVAGAVTIRELGRVLGMALPSTRANTIAGVVSESVGAMPSNGDRVRWGTLDLRVEHVEGRRIEWVVLMLPESSRTSPSGTVASPSPVDDPRTGSRQTDRS